MEYLANQAASTLASGITNVATSLSVASGEGARFPASGNFRCVLTDGTNYEYLLVTARSSDAFTVVREYEDSSRFPKRAWSSGAVIAQVVTVGGLGQYRSDYAPLGLCEGRLTLESGVPISTTDQTAKTTLYFTPYKGNRVALYNGSGWQVYPFTELSLALGTLTSGANYDVFLYDNAGTLTLELLAWTNDTTRATALALQDGVYCKTSALTRRYLGTLRTTSTTTTEDSAAKRLVFNWCNQVRRRLQVVDATASWTYSGTSWRYANNNSANRVELLIGVAGPLLELTLHSMTSQGAASYGGQGIAEDSNTTILADVLGRYTGYQIDPGVTAGLRRHPAVGWHYYAWVERQVQGTANAFGTSTDDILKSGLMGSIDG